MVLKTTYAELLKYLLRFPPFQTFSEQCKSRSQVNSCCCGCVPPAFLNTIALTSLLELQHFLAVIIGDFNLDWMSKATQFNLTQLITKPTWPTTRKFSLLDLILKNRPYKYTHSCVFPIDWSDPCLVCWIRD